MKRLISVLGVAAALSACLWLAGCGGDDDNPVTPPTIVSAEWQMVESGLEHTVRSIAANDTMLVAVGDGGIIYTSADGREWLVQRESGPNDGLTDIIWTDTQFMATGMNGTLITSPDGITWTAYGPGTRSHLYGVAAFDTLMIAVGSGGMIFTSTDGDIWDPLPSLGTIDLFDITRYDDLWITCGSGGKIFRSADGIVWEEQVTVFPAEIVFRSLTASDTRLYVAANDLSSGDSERASVFSSTDGAIWFHESNLPAWYIWDVHWTGTGLVAVGEGTNYHLSFPDGLVFSSTTGASWTEQATEAPFTLMAAATLNGELVVAGGAGYVLSGPSASELEIRTSGADMTGVLWDGSRFVAVTSRGTVMFSADGESWSEQHSHVSSRFIRLAWSGNRYVTLGGFGEPTEIYASPDGDVWSEVQGYDDAYLLDVTYGGGRFLACGQHGTIYSSADGTAWSRHWIGDSVTIQTVIWDGTRYVAAALDGVYYSDDGAAWTEPTVPPEADDPVILRMVWNGSAYAAVGNMYEAGSELVGYWSHAQPDALLWSRLDLGERALFNDLAWNGSIFVMCGREGSLVTTAGDDQFETIDTDTEESLVDIAVNGSQVVVVGGNRTVLSLR